MTNDQESHFSMYYTFSDFQNSHLEITALLPNFQSNYDVLLGTIPQIQEVSEQQKLSHKGDTENKYLLKDRLVVTVADNARKIGTYARFTNNLALADQARLSESKLKLSTDTAIRDYAQMIYNLAGGYLIDLADYGITTESQQQLQELITQYSATIGIPGLNRVARSELTRRLSELFAQAEAALDNMDAAVEIIRLSNPDYYASYKNARKVIPTGADTLALKGLVVDSETSEPIQGVIITISPDGHVGDFIPDPTTLIVKKSAEKGGFWLKTLESGMYDVSLQKMGYAAQTVKIAVNEGEMSKLTIKLVKI